MTKIRETELTDLERAELVNLARISAGLKPRSITQLAKKDIRQREIMDKRLISWGERETMGGRYKTSIGRMVASMGDVVYTEGYDHVLITDFDSMLIELDQLIMNLNPMDNRLIHLEYEIMAQGRQKAWADYFKRSESYYKVRKARILVDLAEKMGVK